MPRNPWLAIDTSTPPAQQAHAVRREWEQFVADGHVEQVRGPVRDSWRRSLDAGVDPSGSRLAPTAVAPDEVRARREAHPLAAAAPLIRDTLASIADASE